MTLTESNDWEALASLMRRTLAQNMTAALSVAGEKQAEIEGTVKKMKLTDLSRKTKIARSTISKLKNNAISKGVQANPDLETICRIASALNVPPAFLLMSKDDWQRLLGALNGLPAALSGPHLEETVFTVTGSDKVSVGLKLTEQIGIYSDRVGLEFKAEEFNARHAEINSEINRNNDMKRLAILTSTAITQSSARNRNDLAVLTAIGAIFGANFKSL